jgi:putative heme-binding domain-containing protein
MSGPRRTPRLALALAALALAVAAPLRAADPAPRLELHAGDHICIIGNTLADRMQHDGWLETYLHARFPTHNLVIRNLGFSGDELTLRLRSMDFGTPDQWLAGSAPCPQPRKLVSHHGVRDNRFETINTKADVVFAFFGYNESFAGEAGLPQFKKDLDDFIKHTLAQKYNGKSAPRLVIFSPNAFEDHKSPNLPDGKDTNKRLELYTKAMGEVAKANNVPFVDLFHPLLLPDAKAINPITFDGIHLNEEGNRRVAATIIHALFDDNGPGIGKPRGPVTVDPIEPFSIVGAMAKEEKLRKDEEKIRQAVIDKNFYWFNRYRCLDGYNVYGDRAFVPYADKQTNYEDQQRELEILDVITADRDKRIWAVAQGKDPPVGSVELPPYIPVKSNFPGKGPNGQHLFLSGEEAIGKMTVARGMKVTLFASEKEWPELQKPVQMQFDAQGRLWVAVWPSYPHWKPGEEMNDKILIFEDTQGTGKADKMTVFADHLHCPTGFDFYNGGVLVAQAPDLIFLKDTKGTGKADLRQRVLHGLDSADSHHTSNSFALDPGGALYFQEGTFHHSQVETAYGPPVRCANAGVFRYEPRTQKFDTYVSFGFANPHGHVWDRWGQDIVYDGTGANPYHGALFSGHLDFPAKHNRPPQVYQQRTRPCPGVEMLTSRHFPPEMQGHLLVANVIGFQGILQYKVEDKGGSLTATEVQPPIVSSTDPNFRPSDLKVGPDGAVWFIDWQNPIIGHLQHALRDPNRDRTHGRIYRVTYDDRPLSEPAQIAGQPVEKLLDLLRSPEDRVRYRVRIELSGRDSNQVIAATKKWVADLANGRHEPVGRELEHLMLEALWVHQQHNVVDVDLLNRLLASPDFRARAAATRVLCYWRDRVPESLDLLRKLAADPHPRVRLEAVRAASFFTEPEAVEVPLIAEGQPADPYVDFVRGETMRALEPYVKKAINSGRQIAFKTSAGSRYFLKNVSTDDLLKMQRSPAVYLELLFRKGVRDEFRKEALAALAKQEHKGELQVLLEAIRGQDQQSNAQDESVVFDLIRLLTGRPAAELAAVRPELEAMATSAHLPVTRELGYVALIAADGTPDKAWSLATRSVAGLQDLVNAMPLIRDPGQKASLYPKIEPLLHGLPKELAATVRTGETVMGRYVRIELPGKRKTLTLAEVEVYSDGRNVARSGKATQSSTSNGGDAAKAIDGNTSGKFGDGGQTHSEENTDSPWWEVDLGAEYSITLVVIYNRTDDGLGKRLANFTLTVSDGQRRKVYQQAKLPAPEVKAAIQVGTDSPERTVRHAAMLALTSVRGQEGPTFKALATFARDGSDRAAAVAALQRIPVRDWPKEEAKPLLDSLLGYVRTVPAKERTAPEVLDAMQLADSLAALLPADEAKQARKELGELGVRVIRVATLPEQMLYNKERLVVQAGKPVEIILDNTDLMPHNLVVTQPGALEEVGTLAESTASQPGALERGYVPPSRKVLFATRLLQPRESQALKFVAPTKPGVYPYVCTYPGHWRRMYGALYVVDDLEAYQADPESYLARHPLPVADDLLKFNRPRTEWKFEDLSGAVASLGSGGRSFGTGKQMFQVATCVACHKLGGTGTELGPDLTKIDPKQDNPTEILKDILDPSFRINEKYQSYTFELKSGKTVTGLILEEKDGLVKVIENPLAKAEPLVLKATEIDERRKSPVSMMPKGLLDKLTKEEILDLIAYVAAKGDEKHRLFQGDHAQGHGH